MPRTAHMSIKHVTAQSTFEITCLVDENPIRFLCIIFTLAIIALHEFLSIDDEFGNIF